ncbi:MAG: PIG-L family deacetylase [Atopostipes suicloacalis]|nr:PIG-L family deacetylase [Atopostipes suicloacalis]
MKKYKRVVSIGGHPLDAELMGGPLALRMNDQGAKSTMMHVTTGRLEDKDASEKEKKEYLEDLNYQIKNVANLLSCEAYQMNYISSDMPKMSEFVEVLYSYFKDEKVDLVITHHVGTMHDRHYFTHRGVKEAVKKLRDEGYGIDLFYGENLEDLVGFVPTAYIQMPEDHVEKWFTALEEYEIFRGKVNTVPYKDYYRTMGRVRGIEAGSPGFVKAYMHAGMIHYK